MIGELLGPYRIDAELGSGGMGQVYAATVVGRAPGLAVGDRVAIKLVHRHLLTADGFFRRFLREAEIGQSVRNANVVRTFDADMQSVNGDQRHFLVMEFVDGQTLRDLLRELGRVPEELCRHIATEIAKGLVGIHDAGVVHRDLKPENVLITPDHSVKIMDLGVARLMDEAVRLSRTGAFVGSFHYAAPEQFRDDAREIDGRADLFALGITLYELATGKHPFTATAQSGMHTLIQNILNLEPPRAAITCPELSPFFEELVHQLLQKEKQRRFPSAARLRETLEVGDRSAWWVERERTLRRSTQAPMRRPRVPRETQLYGRTSDLATLRTAFDAARGGTGQILLLEGESGVGKTRLVDEFVERLSDVGEALHFVVGAYPRGGAATATAALVAAFREHLGLADLEETLTPLLPDTPLLIPCFAAFLRGDALPDAGVTLTRDALQTLFVRLAVALARECTTVILIDDLHLAPDEGRALFAALAHAVRDQRILLIGSMHPGIDESWIAAMLRLEHARLHAVGRLGAKDLAELLLEALGSRKLADALGLQVAQRADGNPLFVFEILRSLRDARTITRCDDGTWERTGDVTAIAIPPSIREMIEARVASLGDDERDLLDVAACCGYEFDPGLIGEVVGLRRIPLLKRLARIERRYRLVRSEGTRYVFDHYQVRVALYEGLSELLRREYHGVLADALKERENADPDAAEAVSGNVATALCKHLFAACRWREGARWLAAALGHLDASYRSEAAVELAERALASGELLDGGARVDLLLSNAQRLDLLSRRDAERVALDTAATEADALRDVARQARALCGLGRHLCSLARYDEAQETLQRALVLAEVSGDPLLAGRAAGTLGNVHYSCGRRHEALVQHERHLAAARAGRDRDGEATALRNLGLTLAALGRTDDAITAIEETIEIAAGLHDLRGEALAAGNLGLIEEARGAIELAANRYEHSLRLARQIGDRQAEARATGNLGNALAAQGEFAAAREYYERQIELSREIGDPRGEARATGNLGSTLQSLGLWDAAERHFARYCELARSIGDREAEAIVLVNTAGLHCALGEWDAAETALRGAQQICADMGDRYVGAYVDLGFAAVEAGRGDVTAALAAVEAAIAVHRELGNRGGIAEASLLLGTLRTRLGDDAGAISALDEASELADQLGLPDVRVEALAERTRLPGGDVAAAADALARLGTRTSVASQLVCPPSPVAVRPRRVRPRRCS